MPWHNAWRLRVFLFVFLVVPLPGLAWAFCARPSTGPWPTVLTAAPRGVGRGLAGEGADPQHRAVKDRLLLGQGLLKERLELARQVRDPGALDADGLSAMRAFTPKPDTNLVELSATPNEPLVGPVPTVDLLRYAPRSPAGPARPMADLRLDYPLP